MELAKGAYPKNPTILPFDQDSTVPVDPQRQIWQFFRFSSDFSCAHGHWSLALHLGKNLHISSSSVRGCKLVLWNYPQSGDGKDNHLRSSPRNLRKHRSRHNTRCIPQCHSPPASTSKVRRRGISQPHTHTAAIVRPSAK